MTLLTFQSRIHFASNVLEEALRAEIEEAGHRRLLLICEARQAGGEFAERVTSGLPHWAEPVWIEIAEGQTKYQTGDAALERIDPETCDAVIAFGAARAIAHGRKCRQAIAQTRYGARRGAARKGLRERNFLPDFCVIPGIDGLPDPCTAAGPMAAHKTAPPSVIICDPSLIYDAGAADEARAFATALGRCLTALGIDTFNPLADGLAVEGLRRLVMARARRAGGADGSAHSRDLMAAALNGAVAQQKGVGVVQSLVEALTETAGREIDGGAVQRILLPRLLAEPELTPRGHLTLVRQIFDLPAEMGLGEGIARLLDPLPLARALRDLPLSRDELRGAARAVAAATHLPQPVCARLGGILDDLY